MAVDLNRATYILNLLNAISTATMRVQPNVPTIIQDVLTDFADVDVEGLHLPLIAVYFSENCDELCRLIITSDLSEDMEAQYRNAVIAIKTLIVQVLHTGQITRNQIEQQSYKSNYESLRHLNEILRHKDKDTNLEANPDLDKQLNALKKSYTEFIKADTNFPFKSSVVVAYSNLIFIYEAKELFPSRTFVKAGMNAIGETIITTPDMPISSKKTANDMAKKAQSMVRKVAECNGYIALVERAVPIVNALAG